MAKVRSRTRRIVLLAFLFVVIFFAVSFVYTLLVSLGPSSACRSPTDAPVQPGTTTARTLISGGYERCYLMHVPPSYDPAQPLPLVVVLHGLASNAEMIQGVSGWDIVADREGFIVVYPDGMLYPLRWNANSNMNLEVDDVQFFRELVEKVSTMVSVDPTRVSATGLVTGDCATRAICRHNSSMVC